MGTSWYDPAGPTPNFVSGQTNGTTYSARLGDDALLDCKVTSLERDLVSWFRGAAAMPECLFWFLKASRKVFLNKISIQVQAFYMASISN